MNIYTKTGDSGETGLFGGSRIHKHHKRIHAYGLIDELNSHIGLVIALQKQDSVDAELTEPLETVQHMLLCIGSHLATPYTEDSIPDTLPKIPEHAVEALEKKIDALEEHLPPLTEFILPGGSVVGAYLHLARTAARTAERAIVELHNDTNATVLPEILQYMNRLSDFLFVLARTANHAAGKPETAWQK